MNGLNLRKFVLFLQISEISAHYNSGDPVPYLRHLCINPLCEKHPFPHHTPLTWIWN